MLAKQKKELELIIKEWNEGKEVNLIKVPNESLEDIREIWKVAFSLIEQNLDERYTCSTEDEDEYWINFTRSSIMKTCGMADISIVASAILFARVFLENGYNETLNKTEPENLIKIKN
jgi:hypothetical protein